jgi:hypothetical protein
MTKNLPKQITKKIKGYRKQDLNQLMMKDIYWTLTEHPNGPIQTRTKNIQLESMNLKVSYANGERLIEATFPRGVSVKFGTQYFENFSDIKFVSLVYLILDEFGPIYNPMAFQNIINTRNDIGIYRNFQSKSVLRRSLKTEPVFQSLLFMTTILVE